MNKIRKKWIYGSILGALTILTASVSTYLVLSKNNVSKRINIPNKLKKTPYMLQQVTEYNKNDYVKYKELNYSHTTKRFIEFSLTNDLDTLASFSLLLYESKDFENAKKINNQFLKAELENYDFYEMPQIIKMLSNYKETNASINNILEGLLDSHYDSSLGFFRKEKNIITDLDYRITTDILYALKKSDFIDLFRKYKNDYYLINFYYTFNNSKNRVLEDTSFYALSLIDDNNIKKENVEKIQNWKTKIFQDLNYSKFNKQLRELSIAEIDFMYFIYEKLNNLNVDTSEFEIFLKKPENIDENLFLKLISAEYHSQWFATFWKELDSQLKNEYFKAISNNSKIYEKTNATYMFYASLFSGVNIVEMRNSISNLVHSFKNYDDVTLLLRDIKYVLKTQFYNKNYRSYDLDIFLKRIIDELDLKKLKQLPLTSQLDYLFSCCLSKYLNPDLDIEIKPIDINSLLNELSLQKDYLDFEILITLYDVYIFLNKEIPNLLKDKINFEKHNKQKILDIKNIIDFYFINTK
ncbi:hypothetical protein [Mycoplasma hafezii]|uniref:hypothetical protein n=1 Tax=Mycoplasma hafezii TaxID=525886 RepID=UPI003CF558DB